MTIHLATHLFVKVQGFRCISTQSMSPVIFKKWKELKEKPKTPTLSSTNASQLSRKEEEQRRLGTKSSAFQLYPRHDEKTTSRPEITVASSFTLGSPQKLNQVGRQIARLSLEEAMLQMKFSPKRAALKVISTLQLIKEKAARLQVSTDDMIIESATVGRGRIIKTIDIKARGRMGIRKNIFSSIRITLKEPNYSTIYRKRYKMIIPKENKPVYFKLDY